jgi:dipeptidyl aminopeptidase/acylaminoacyl peptidase
MEKQKIARLSSVFKLSVPLITRIALALLLGACASKKKAAELAGAAAPAAYSGHGASSVDMKRVTEFAPPALDPEVARKILNILEIRSPGAGRLTPDGKTMFFGWGVTGIAQIWRLDRPLGFPTQFTSGNDVTRNVDITPDGRYLVVSRDHAGEENPGLYLQPVSGGPLIEVQTKKGIQTQYAWTSKNSRFIFFLANDIKPDSYALYRYDVENKKRELLFSEPGLWSVSDVLEAGGLTKFILARATGSLTSEFFEWELGEKKLKAIIGQNEKQDYSVSFGSSPSEYLVLTPKFGEFKRLYRLQAGKLSVLTPDVKMDVESFTVDDPHRRVYLQWNDKGGTKLDIRDINTFAEQRIPDTLGDIKKADIVHIRMGSLTRDGRYVTLSVETSLRPRTSYVFDWKTNRLTQWVRPGLPEIDTSRFVSSKLESFPSRDGVQIPMLVYRPKVCAAQPCPVVVHFHGGPEGQSRPGFNSLAQIFTDAGFVYAEPNVRGSEGYGKSWLAADDGAKRLNVISDIEDCSKFIRSNWGSAGRAPKVGVMGWSYGGYSTLMAMTRFAGAYDAGVALVGMSNLRSFLLNTAPYRRTLRISEYGDPEADQAALEKLSPTTYLGQVRDPLMLMQGVSDPRVPVGEAIQMHELLKSRGIDSPLVLFANEGHGSQQKSNQVLELGHTLKFFQQHLLK